ncbi:MAG: glutamine--fructose-6-phosphate transaminase (isomerizing) [Elusimicrobia bacterium]|nr:glutamine--fructose-6-phosphate transaminase (isomerizing) [Candidatus Obscuribacterium magneticum]
MCGIVGYVGFRDAHEVLLEGLKRLEYRGYDSAGVAMVSDQDFFVKKTAGKVAALADLIRHDPKMQNHITTGIAHTRWATHGLPTEINAHPHMDGQKQFAVVHNGIIDNYVILKERLAKSGHKFLSSTDTEVIPHLIQEFYKGDLVAAVAAALKQMEGTYGIAVVSKAHPDEIVVARKGSPIVIGVGEKEVIIASDVSAIASYTSKVIYLNDNDIAKVTPHEVQIRNLDNLPVSRETSTIDWDIASVEKGEFEHFMVKEIFDQPESIRNAIRGRLSHENGNAILSGLNMSPRDLVSIDRIIIPACGTSLHAGMIGKYYFEDLAGIPTEVEQSAEFRYRNPVVGVNTLVIAISQSGETADTLAAIREAKMKGAQIVALSNVVGSTIARESERGIYIHAGPEISVAATKTFTSQVAVLLMMALKLGRAHRMTQSAGCELAKEIESIPELIQKVLDSAPKIQKVAKKWSHVRDFFFIGRGYMYPIALEGALKLKEVSYVHAEGYHASELKHGPIALLEKNVPVMALAIDCEETDKTISNIQECLARQSPVLLTCCEGDSRLCSLTEDVIQIPRSSQFVAPIITAVVLQLFSYYLAKERGCPIDQPRNLAKSVTVE